ncbi:hypothetical protein GCM10022237_43950 [Nocardioides ginsengisoli]|uniref:ImmA/IrrE family metallo-endopeptidase n=1 Tax=Nocardioides ginsengisoli TaxID=363868 RepID=A0ABW3VYR7_9ACTN
MIGSAVEIELIRERARADAGRILAEHWDDGVVPVDPRAIETALAAPAHGRSTGSRRGVSLLRSRFASARRVSVLARGAVVRDLSRQVDDIYANEFAVALLLPEPAFTSAKADGLDEIGLGKRFQVSPTVARWRALQLALRGERGAAACASRGAVRSPAPV